MYCVYLTTYSGSKLPPFYIGSSTIKRVTNGYHGSVKSKKYKEIFNQELMENSHLFKTKIIKEFTNRIDALDTEKRIQEKLGVVKSPMYMNMSIAKNFGWFGMDTKGVNSPAYGKRWKKTQEQIENSRKASLIAFNKPEFKQAQSERRRGKIPFSEAQIIELKLKYNKIFNKYNEQPKLEHGYVLKNGKVLTYPRAFAKAFADDFSLTINGLHQILCNYRILKGQTSLAQ